LRHLPPPHSPPPSPPSHRSVPLKERDRVRRCEDESAS
jgi:hypothetical protein